MHGRSLVRNPSERQLRGINPDQAYERKVQLVHESIVVALFQLKFGRTSPPRLPQALQVKRGSISESLRSSGWAAAGLMDTEIGVSVAQAARDLDVHENVLRKWVKKFGADAAHAFPGHGQMKPEQQEITRLRREVAKPSRSTGRSGRGMAMRCAWGVSVGLPRLAEPLSQR
jgi:transposase